MRHDGANSLPSARWPHGVPVFLIARLDIAQLDQLLVTLRTYRGYSSQLLCGLAKYASHGDLCLWQRCNRLLRWLVMRLDGNRQARLGISEA